MHSIPSVARTLATTTVGAIVQPLVGRWKASKRRRKLRLDVTRMDDRTLRDIGLSRTDLIARRVLKD